MANAISARRRRIKLSPFVQIFGGIACLSLVAAPAVAALFSPRPSQLIRQAKRIGDWRLQIVRDRFSGAVACRLRSVDGMAFYSAGAVSFRFRTGQGVAAAVYRIDNGAVWRARDDLPELIAQGAPVDRGPPGDATMGQVWVPYERLAAANRIAIEPRRDTAPRSFRVGGLAALHDLAMASGCAPDTRFGE